MTGTESTPTNSTTQSTETTETSRPSVAISEENLAALLRAVTNPPETLEPPPAKPVPAKVVEDPQPIAAPLLEMQPLEVQSQPVESKLALIATIREHRSAVLRAEATAAAPPVLPVPVSVPLEESKPAEPPQVKATPQPAVTPLPKPAPAPAPSLKTADSFAVPASFAASAKPERGIFGNKLVIGLIAGGVLLTVSIVTLLPFHHKPVSTKNAAPMSTINVPEPTTESAPTLPSSAPFKAPEPVAANAPLPSSVKPSQPQPRAFTPPPAAIQSSQDGIVLDAPPVSSAATTAPPVAALTPALAPISPSLPGDSSAPRQIRVESNLQSANLIRKVAPVYPALAKAASIQGTVRFTAIIGKDGRIQNLKANSGPPLLIEAAASAVKQWVYRPTLLNGEAVEVITQIDVNFTSTH